MKQIKRELFKMKSETWPCNFNGTPLLTNLFRSSRPIHLSNCQIVRFSFCPFVRLSVCLFVHLSFCPFDLSRVILLEVLKCRLHFYTLIEMYLLLLCENDKLMTSLESWNLFVTRMTFDDVSRSIFLRIRSQNTSKSNFFVNLKWDTKILILRDWWQIFMDSIAYVYFTIKLCYNLQKTR